MKHKHIHLITAGTLHATLLHKDFYEVTSIQVEGPIDSRDFSAMRNIVHLTNVDIFNCKIEAYNDNKADEIPANAFMNCRQLEKIVLPRMTISIGVEAFHKCLELQSIHIPANLMSIQASAFYYCEKLKYILLPENVKSIGQWAFAGCISLQNIIVKSKQLIEIEADSHVFWGVNRDECVVWVSEKCEAAYAAAPQWRFFSNFNQRVPLKEKKRSFFFQFRPITFQIRNRATDIIWG